MRSLWFVVPVHGRLGLTGICLRHLRRTCDALLERDVKATAVVVSDADSLDALTVGDLGFGWVRRDNQFTSRRFNDGIQLATDPRFNPAPADFVVPFGSDDWADYRLFTEPLPQPDEIFGFHKVAFVREDGRQIASTYLDYRGGSGIRIIPRELVAAVGYRPAEEDRENGCDRSILTGLYRQHGHNLKVRDEWHLSDYQIVDWKTPGEQLTPYKTVIAMKSPKVSDDPFTVLAPYYDADLLDEMHSYYGLRSNAEVAA